MLNLEYFLKKNYKKGIYFETPPAIGIWKQIGLLWKYYPNEASAKNDLKKIITLNKLYWNDLYKIPIITKKNNKILHLQVVQSHYVILIKKYSQLLAENGDMEGAKIALKKILKLNSEDKLNTKFILMNLYVFEKKCPEAKKIKVELNNIDYSKNKLFLESVLEYYQTCEPKNVEINKIKNQIKQVDLKNTPNLKSF